MEILWPPEKELNDSSVSLMTALPPNCTLFFSLPLNQSESSACCRPLPPPLHPNLTDTRAEWTDKYLEPFSQRGTLALIWATARVHRGGRRKLINEDKVLCIICSSGSCREMLSYCFADLTLIPSSVDFAAKLCPILYRLSPEELISILFFKAFYT